MIKYFRVDHILMKINTESMKALFIDGEKLFLTPISEKFLDQKGLKKITKKKFNDELRLKMRIFKSFA